MTHKIDKAYFYWGAVNGFATVEPKKPNPIFRPNCHLDAVETYGVGATDEHMNWALGITSLLSGLIEITPTALASAAKGWQKYTIATGGLAATAEIGEELKGTAQKLFINGYGDQAIKARDLYNQIRARQGLLRVNQKLHTSDRT